jgi:hypothetical protein
MPAYVFLPALVGLLVLAALCAGFAPARAVGAATLLGAALGARGVLAVNDAREPAARPSTSVGAPVAG